MPPQVAGLSLVAGLAVIEAVEFLLPELHQQLQLKWVNDIWLNRRKLAGILCEGAGDRVIVGVGLNRCVTFDDPTAIGYPVSLHEFVATVPDELILLEQIRHTLLKFSDRLIRQGLQDFLAALNFRDGLIDHKIEVQTEHDFFTGDAVGIDAQGRLRLQTADGHLQTLVNARIVKWHKTT
jgi:BirA family biotin operon repressor/biotin-[acetyl-CoA-carboxylase] ligase